MKKIAIIIGLCVLMLVSISMLFTKPVDIKNSTIIKGHFKSIIQKVYKGDYSYDVYIQENNEKYGISADYSHCFQYYKLKNTVEQGQLLQISLCSNNFLQRTFVVSLIVGNIDYVSQDCINKKISDNKILIPGCSLAFTLIMVLYLTYDKKKEKD